MSFLSGDAKFYGSATMADDNVATQIGGAISLSRKISFADAAGTIQIVSESASDTTQTIQVFYLDSNNALQNETHTLTGQTPVVFTANVAHLMKAIKSGTSTGGVAVEAQTAIRTSTCGGTGKQNTIILDASALYVDNDSTIVGSIIRTTAGSGANQIREIIGYTASNQEALVSEPWGPSGPPDATTAYRIANGFSMERLPNEILEARRPFYNAAANIPGGGAANFYDLVYLKNANASLTLSGAIVQLLSNTSPNARVNFGLGAAINTAYDNGGGNNRTVAPAGITFGQTNVSVPGGATLTAGSYIAVWLQAALVDGDFQQFSSFILTWQGTAVDVTQTLQDVGPMPATKLKYRVPKYYRQPAA